MSWARILQELLEHIDLIELAIRAIKGGVSKEELVDMIKKKMTEASDAQMRRDFPNE